MFSSTFYRTYKEQCNKNHSNGEEEFFTRPNSSNTKGIKPFNYDKLNPDGFVPENGYVDDGDIIIGKCMPQKIDTVITYKDTSIALKSNEFGFIDKNSYGDKYFTNVNGDGYNFCKIRMRNMRIPTIGDKFCLVPETDVLTSTGWKRITEISREDKVAQLNETNVIEYVHPREIYEFDHTGDMFHLNSPHVSLITTMEHKMFVRRPGAKQFGLTEAKYLMQSDVHYKKNGLNNRVPHQDWFNIQDNTQLPMNEWMFFLGRWYADGWIEPEFGHLTISVACANVQFLMDRVCEILSLQVVKTESEWYIYNKELLDYLMPFRNQDHLPSFVFDVHQDHAEAFVDGFFSKGAFTTQHKGLMDDIQRVLLHAGLSGDISFDRTFESYTIQLHDYVINNEPLISHHDVHTMCYSGKVYCIEVPSHVFYVRHNGKGVWTGNSSRHGQKGTMGMMYRQEDMPFTKDGIVPDIIMNPHAVPSRMTIAQLMECLLGKACTSLGTYGDATPFTDLTVEDIASLLEKQGIERYGNEILYNPQTGQQMNTLIFIGPTFYQRLKHMTVDKTHSRSSNGPVVLLTRQPAEGRARNGGLRLGEMELDACLAHGISSFLKERFMECSDNYRVFVCKRCGMLANVNPDKNRYECKYCKNSTMFSEIRSPYTCKLMLQELQTMALGMRFITS